VVRRTSHDSYERIGHLLDRVHIVPADLLDQHSLTVVVRDAKPDEIYNLAAQSFVPTSWTQPVLTGEFTALGVTRLLEAEGVKLDDMPRKVPNGSTIAYITDPWGTRIELIERAPLGPEVKYSLSGSAASPLPKTIAQSPSILTAWPLGSCSWPRKSPPEVKPLIRPSPKLPIKIRVLNGPKSKGARAIPQGELSAPREAKRVIKLPSVSKTSTKP